MDQKRTWNVSYVTKGLQEFGGGPLIEEEYDVDFWSYSYYGECVYVTNLCALPAELLVTWYGSYVVHSDPLCSRRAILMA